MFFPITGMFLDPLLILFAGLVGGFVSGFLGLGCGVIITPVLMEFGVPPMIALATQLCHAVGTNFTTFLTYKRKMDVDFHLAIYILLGGTLGALFEWIILKTSANSRFAFNKFIYVYILILTIFGVIMLVQSYKTWRHNDTAKYKKSVFLRRWMLYLPLHKIFVRSRAEMSIIIPFFVGFLAGLLVSSLGGGNNLFMAPIITYLIGRISPVVYGTTALAGCVITAIIALVYSTNDYCCDILFVLLLFVGASVGSWIGVQLTYKVKRYFIYAIGALIVFLMATRQIYNLIHGIFSKNYNSKIDLSQSIVGTIVGEDSLTYTFACIVLIITIAFCCEKFMQSWYIRGRKLGEK